MNRILIFSIILILSFMETSAQLPTANAGADIIGCPLTNTKLNGSATGTGITYKWTPSQGLSNDSILNPIISVTGTTLYTLTVTDQYGYKVQDQVAIILKIDDEILNTFSPNGDGINDVWDLKCWNQYNNISEVTIVTRSGKTVFHSNGYAIPWDGGTSFEGTYYYHITLNSGPNPPISWIYLRRAPY